MAPVEPKTESTIMEENVRQVSADVDHNIHHPKKWLNVHVILYMIVIGLSMGLFGYDNSFAAPLVSLPYFILKYQGNVAPAFTAKNLDLLVPVPLVGAAFGTFIAAPVMERFGRKKTFFFAYFLFCTPGSFLQLFAPNMAALVCGRFWNYLGISMLTTTAPLYLSEMVPAHVRGRAIGFCSAGVAAVAVVATTIVWATQRIADDRSFKIPLAIQAACPVVFGCLTVLVPESPVWQIQHDKLDAAHSTLMVIRNKQVDVVDAEMSMHQLAIRQNAERLSKVRFWDILNKANIKRTLTAGTLLSASQVGGQVLVLSYSTVILVQSGVGNPFQVTVIITCLQFLGTIVGPVLVDTLGRRMVSLWGFSILFLLNLAAGGLAAAGLDTEAKQTGLASVLIVFGFFNAASFQSLAWVLPTEVAVSTLREPTVAWSIFWSYTTAVITTFAVPQIMSPDAGNLGAKTAFVFAGCMLVTIVWAYFYLPETMARTTAEIDEMYAIKLPLRKWKGHQCQVVNTAAQKVDEQHASRNNSAV